SKNIYGPYEDKIVLHQGSTPINGPHQGGWVELDNGEFWFVHFQDRDAYGRIVHLQPMHWENDWPVMGINQNKDGIGEPVIAYKKPGVKGTYPICVPETSDDFTSQALGLQWQWHGNPKKEWYSLECVNYLRLNSQYYQKSTTLWEVSNLLLQKFPAPEFQATAKIEYRALETGDQIGFVVMGLMYHGLFIKRSEIENAYELSFIEGDVTKGVEEETIITKVVNSSTIYFQLKVNNHALCEFLYSLDSDIFQRVGSFTASKGKWIGAKFGLVCWNREQATQGSVNVDWCIVE
ncbi:MAG: glycoside hydrolase, partial [Vallitaleaceae bacterium]|nr:glycoside hydrolase [Vallitaleaceae bacterium]